MKYVIQFLFLLIFLTSGTHAQVVRPLAEEKWSESDPDAKYYTLKGYRHGAIFFPKVKYPEVEYTPSSTLTFDKYYAADNVCN